MAVKVTVKVKVKAKVKVTDLVMAIHSMITTGKAHKNLMPKRSVNSNARSMKPYVKVLWSQGNLVAVVIVI